MRYHMCTYTAACTRLGVPRRFGNYKGTVPSLLRARNPADARFIYFSYHTPRGVSKHTNKPILNIVVAVAAAVARRCPSPLIQSPPSRLLLRPPRPL